MFNDVERRKGNMKTNELEKEIGLSKYTIRYYEKEGLIQPKEKKMVIVIMTMKQFKS